MPRAGPQRQACVACPKYKQIYAYCVKLSESMASTERLQPETLGVMVKRVADKGPSVSWGCGVTTATQKGDEAMGVTVKEITLWRREIQNQPGNVGARA